MHANDERWASHPVPGINPENVHVYPLFGREHECVGLSCWCHPERSRLDERIILHNVEH